MRPPWLGHSRDEAELEALQTDIMRFMAILGLCLAAIFSLVQGAAQEQAAAERATVEQTIVEVEPETPAQKRMPAMLQNAPQTGFTLEFASVRALEMLLQAGKVQLYAKHGDQFWSVDADGVAVAAQAPSSYYQMHTATVPTRLRGSVPGNAIGTVITWGVTLPTEAIGQIQRLTTGRKGGNLLIAHDGTVALDSGVLSSQTGTNQGEY